jgi:hypothetical protein
VLVEEHLELGAGWLIDDTLGERRGQGMHVRRPTATSLRHPEQLANIGVSGRILSTVPIAEPRGEPDPAAAQARTLHAKVRPVGLAR